MNIVDIADIADIGMDIVLRQKSGPPTYVSENQDILTPIKEAF